MARCFDPSFHIRTVTLVGLGGTGSQLSRLLARILYDMRRSRLHTPMLRFIDPDRVELKNCGRQSFCDAEVGQYKAEVLARRYNCALGLEIMRDCSTGLSGTTFRRRTRTSGHWRSGQRDCAA